MDGDAIPTTLTDAQTKLVDEKFRLVQRSRDLQVELARVRSEMALVDQNLVKGGLGDIIVACW